MTVETELPVGVCVCGQPIPESSPSEWACGEPCQSAWLMHQADPEYPHPQEIRAAAQARAAQPPTVPVLSRRPATRQPGAPDGTEIDVDGQGYVRIGSHWQQTGPWSILESDLATALQYRRWCPGCQVRRPYELVSPPPGVRQPVVQVCAECERQWPGRPLIGVIETRGEPWPSIRMRITDGFRSAGRVYTEDGIAALAARHARPAAELLVKNWLKLERSLSGGFSDQDQASARRRDRGRARVWDWRER